MCGRYALQQDGAELAKLLDLVNVPDWRGGDAEIFPGENVPALRAEEKNADDNPWRAENFRWGLRPSWATEKSRGQINARLETLAERPFFRDALRRRRCLVPASAFFEWESAGADTRGAKTKKKKWRISPADEPLFLFAALWEPSPDGAGLAIVTCAAAGSLARIHHRSPLILSRKSARDWLGGGGSAEVRAKLAAESPSELRTAAL
ncbi:MAG: SOS response-associated peptidase [Alphaproteobacteria bacterium]|nr:SOS response-associated peptidase [Alphaproteobacteria bacterium]MDA7988410.1 SOS response-associated peptidase [Alphaproteobacteria bacterium]MDA8008766.1 SOS response-associated peptidase [Alphaproteobacteria bacterium]